MAMNPIVRAQLENFKKMNPNSGMADDELFEVMSIFAIENGVLGENIDPFKAHLSGTEFGIDGVAISIQGKLCTDIDDALEVLSIGKNHTSEFHFFQAKTSENLDYGNISKFLDAIYDFFTTNELNESEQLESLIEIKDEIYKAAAKTSPMLKCFYCTTGNGLASDLIQKLIETNKDRLNELNIFSDIHIECVGAKVIQNGFRSATNSTTAKINFPKAITMPAHQSVDQAYIGYIPANELLSIVLGEADQEGNRHINRAIFYDNVRDFNPDSEINQSIIEELKNGGNESFVFKNNGITVVSRSIDRKGDTFTLEDYQIVNGCQTTNIIAHVRDNLENTNIPLRLIGCSDPDFVSSIIIGTNKQNQVKEDQFLALLPFMKDLEEYCSAQPQDYRIFIERRDNQYRSIAVERTRILKPSDLMKSVAAMFLFQPNRAARDHRAIRKEYSNKIFSEKHNVELYHLAALALYRFDYLIRTEKVERSKALFKYYSLYALIRVRWDNSKILEASPKNQSRMKNEVLDILIDNDKFTYHIESVSKILDGIIDEAKIQNREKVRDYIRSDTVVEEFTKRLLSQEKLG